jgi:hypothetical protein
LPHAGPPSSNVVRPRGTPPAVMSSKPAKPVGAFPGASTGIERPRFMLIPSSNPE